MYALGLGPTTDVLFGALALPSGVRTPALYAGMTPGFVGLYQINVLVAIE